jgi:hypothetical protein
MCHSILPRELAMGKALGKAAEIPGVLGATW